MSLTREQQRDLNQLAHYFKKLEKLALANNIDLDVFMTEYREDGFQVYATERISRATNNADRKSIFEKSQQKESRAQKHH